MTFDCHKCSGTGQTSFHHIENGVCFACGGSGKLAYRPKASQAEAHPEWLVPAASRATDKQWSFLVALCGDNSDTFCRIIKAAGAPSASLRYVSKAVISKAIKAAKADEAALRWRKANRTMQGAA
jgi:hypothetical protein